MSLISALMPFLIASIIASILESLLRRFGIRKRFLGTGLYLLVIPVVFRMTSDTLPSRIVLTTILLGLATIVGSFWWANRSEAKAGRIESTEVSSESEPQ